MRTEEEVRERKELIKTEIDTMSNTAYKAIGALYEKTLEVLEWVLEEGEIYKEY